jgi:hypothetical protein
MQRRIHRDMHRVRVGVRFGVAVGICAVLLSGLVSAPAPVAAQDPATYSELPQPEPGQYDEAAVTAIDLEAVPIVPVLEDTDMAEYIRAIYEEGIGRGNNGAIFSKVGDCMTATPNFMEGFTPGNYDLGEYTDTLQPVLDRFTGVPVRGPEFGKDSFTNPSLAAASGFNVAGVLDPIWNDPTVCDVNASPLACEFGISKPSMAIIMFGTNDLRSLTPEDFDLYLRRVVVETVNAGVVPILSTFPEQASQVERSILLNQITVDVAADYNVPLMNLWLALDTLPNKGVDPEDTTHMTAPEDGATANLTEDYLQYGANMRNLVTLQALAEVLKVVGES